MIMFEFKMFRIVSESEVGMVDKVETVEYVPSDLTKGSLEVESVMIDLLDKIENFAKIE